MKFYFFDHNGKHLYTRSDAISFKHTEEDYSFKGEFPLDDHLPAVGNLVGWIDDEDLWQVHEICKTETSVFGESIEISGSHLAVMELSNTIIKSISVDNVSAKSAINSILSAGSTATTAIWSIGNVPAAADDDDITVQRYRVTAKYISLFAKTDTSSKKLGQYKKGKYMSLLEQINNTWWRIEAGDGRVGYVYDPTNTNRLVRDGFVGDSRRKTTLDDKYATAWDLITQVSKDTGLVVYPRIDIQNDPTNCIKGRYLDIRRQDPEYRGIRLTCNTNIEEGVVIYDIANLYTALYGIGKDEATFSDVTWTKSGGFPADKPSGQTWIGNPEAAQQWGYNGRHRFGVVHFDTISNHSTLINRTWEALESACVPDITIDGTIADLYKMGYGGQAMRLYDKVYCIIEPLGLHIELRISGIERDLVTPEKTNPTIGALK